MFEEVGRLRRNTLLEKQTCCDETVERRYEFRFGLANRSLQECMRELTPYCCADLRDFFRRS